MSNEEVAVLVPDETQVCLGFAGKYLDALNDLGYHPGLVSPPCGGGFIVGSDV